MNDKTSILYIDDEPENLSGFKYIYRKDYDIHLARTAEEGLDILRKNQIQVIVTDQRMPAMTGVEFLEKTREEFPDPMRIILTGYSDVEAVIQAINRGQIYRYVTKPWDKDELKVTIDNAIGSYNLKIENKNLIDSLKKANSQLEETNRNLEKTIEIRTLEIQKKNLELEKHQNHLEKIVLERTKDLKKAKEKAEESDKLKSAFLANLSHELRTPMNAIIGFSNLLNDSDINNTDKNEFIRIINQNGNALLKLIDDIIDISQIEANQVTISMDEFSINALITELYTYYSTQKERVGKQKIQLTYKVPNEKTDFFIRSDKVRIRQIITNLLDNAFKFTKEGIVNFGYKISQCKGFLEFYVKDTGTGIKKEDQDIIFSRFRKIQPQQDEGELYSGSGLGLAISKSLVELLGGEIGLKSQAGKGSEFYFTVPLIVVSKEQLVEKSSEKRLIDDMPDWKNKQILVAEDEETNFKFIETALKKTQIQLYRAKNGKQVIELVDHHPKIDIILMDIGMPEMDGYEATKAIKKMNNAIPIIAQTAYARENDRIQVFEVGCDGYISKPYKADELLELINKFIS